MMTRMMIRVVVVRLLLRSAAPEDDPPGGGGRGRHSPVLVKDERDDRMEKMHRVSKDILEKTKSFIMQTLNLKKQE